MSKFVTLHGFGGGSSGIGLNFEIVGGTTQPTNPKENTIWVNTDVEISGWIFSVTEPESPVEGMVWNAIGTSSTTDFNALKNNGIQVYPISAKQYVGGAWVNVDAASYQDGKWVNWCIYLFDGSTLTKSYGTFGNPNKYTYYSTTGHNKCGVSSSVSSGVLNLSFTKSSGDKSYDSSYAYFSEMIDFTSISSIEISINSKSSSSAAMALTVLQNLGNSPTSVASTGISAGTKVLDVSALTGNHYLAISYYNNTTSGTVTLKISKWRLV